MDSLENYLLAVMKENKVTLEPNDPLCVLHTILSKFEDDLLESQRKCLEAFKSDIEASFSSIEATEKLRAERALSYIQASAEKMLVGLPEKLNSAIQQEAFKKQLLKYALEAIPERMTVPIPQKLWIFGACLAGLNILVLIMGAILLF